MRSIRTCLFALFALFALGASITSVASAVAPLPEWHCLKGVTECGLSGSLTVAGGVAARLVSGLGTVTAEKVELKTTTGKELGSLGKYTAIFLGVKFGAKECWTEKPPAVAKDEHVVVEDEYHLVLLSDKPLTLGILFLLTKEVDLKCGQPKQLKSELLIDVRGMALGAVNGVTAGTETTAAKGNLKCNPAGTSTQEFKEYLNDKEEFVKGNLEANAGLGFEKACEEATAELPLTAASGVTFLF